MEVMTKYKIHPLLEKRWSPRAFSPEPIAEEDVNEIFTAASWAASAMNEQPWQYVYAMRGTPGFDDLWDCLATGNKPWTKHAAVLFVAIKVDTFSDTGKPNKWAMHDVGMANAQLLLQATSKDIYGHLMAGFGSDQVKELLQLDDNLTPVCMGALGYLGEADELDEPYRSREKAPRTRKDLEEFVRKI